MWLDPMQLGVGSGFLFLRIRSQIEVVYAVAAGDAFSRPNSSATACSTTVPLEEARIVARVQHGGIGERELAKTRNGTLPRGYLGADVANIVRDNCMELFHQGRSSTLVFHFGI